MRKYIRIPIAAILSQVSSNGKTNEENLKRLNISEWYKIKYHEDSLKDDINEYVTFYDLFLSIIKHEDIYYLLGVSDSVVRERVFKELGSILGIGYISVYYAWLNS